MTAVKEKKKSLPVKHKVVADIIRVGKENTTLLSDIMILANIRNNRQAYLIIEELINKYGYVIVASRRGKHRGYYYPAGAIIILLRLSIISSLTIFKYYLRNATGGKGLHNLKQDKALSNNDLWVYSHATLPNKT